MACSQKPSEEAYTKEPLHHKQHRCQPAQSVEPRVGSPAALEKAPGKRYNGAVQWALPEEAR
jgi:hypothetical protein